MRLSQPTTMAADVMTLAPRQGATLRAGFPKDAKNHRVYGVLDDSDLQGVLKRGKAWTAKARQSMQSMQAGRPLDTSTPWDLLAEAASMKLDLSPEVRPVARARYVPSNRRSS